MSLKSQNILWNILFSIFLQWWILKSSSFFAFTNSESELHYLFLMIHHAVFKRKFRTTKKKAANTFVLWIFWWNFIQMISNKKKVFLKVLWIIIYESDEILLVFFWFCLEHNYDENCIWCLEKISNVCKIKKTPL